ncbi:hypothetical protein AVEN_146609-1 [Araneus ventricosus]|uniref:Uncharacterized protein n=1 Tax=Araneus ventricosus TaxID=182803 RepID=A0A4Y2RP33_ARAVE|nr:hypothetical protein AVEN_146609-1 [Araneus ventricosus]
MKPSFEATLKVFPMCINTWTEEYGRTSDTKWILRSSRPSGTRLVCCRGPFTYSEIFSKIGADNRTWRIPPIHDWYQQKHPGAALELKGDRKLQTAITRFISGHSRTLSYLQGQKVFPVCLKCDRHQSTPDHLLSCMELEKRKLFESPALVRDSLWASGLMDLV